MDAIDSWSLKTTSIFHAVLLRSKIRMACSCAVMLRPLLLSQPCVAKPVYQTLRLGLISSTLAFVCQINWLPGPAHRDSLPRSQNITLTPVRTSKSGHYRELGLWISVRPLYLHPMSLKATGPEPAFRQGIVNLNFSSHGFITRFYR